MTDCNGELVWGRCGMWDGSRRLISNKPACPLIAGVSYPCPGGAGEIEQASEQAGARRNVRVCFASFSCYFGNAYRLISTELKKTFISQKYRDLTSYLFSLRMKKITF